MRPSSKPLPKSLTEVFKQVAKDELTPAFSRCNICGNVRDTKADIGTTCYNMNEVHGTKGKPCLGKFLEPKHHK